MTYTEKELDQFLHGISLSLLSKKSAQHWRYDEETAEEIEWLEALERKVRADIADRKTENSSEIPNNCEHITEDGVTCAKYPACDDCLDNPLNKVKGSERLVKGKDESQTDWHYDEQDATWYPYKHEDEPQTCSFSDCDNFKNPDYERCIECKRKQIKLKTEQTERSEQMDEFTSVESTRIVWHVAYHNNDRPKVRLFETQEEAERCFNALSGHYEWVSLDKSIIEHTDTADTPQTDCEACELDGKADVCKICRVSNYEPQTDCGWK